MAGLLNAFVFLAEQQSLFAQLLDHPLYILLMLVLDIVQMHPAGQRTQRRRVACAQFLHKLIDIIAGKQL